MDCVSNYTYDGVSYQVQAESGDGDTDYHMQYVLFVDGDRILTQTELVKMGFEIARSDESWVTGFEYIGREYIEGGTVRKALIAAENRV